MAQMRNPNGWSAENEAPMADFGLIPKGWQPAIVEQSEEKPIKDNKGDFLALTFQIIEGPFKGRKLWENLNLWHKQSEKAVKFSWRAWGSICKAVGVICPQQSEEVHNILIGINIGHKKNDNSGEMENKVIGFCSQAELAAKGTPATYQNTNPAPQQQQAQAPQAQAPKHGGWGVPPQAQAQPPAHTQQQPAQPQLPGNVPPQQPQPQAQPPQQPQGAPPVQPLPQGAGETFDVSDESIDDIPF